MLANRNHSSTQMKFRTNVFFLFFYGIFTVTYASNFYVAAPKILRLNAEETVALAMDGAAAALVNISVQDYPQKSKTIVNRLVELHPGKPKVFVIQLDPKDFPPNFFVTTSQPKYVCLTANFQEFSKDIVIPVTSQSGHIFIQTDRPIYTPRQRVTFRIIPVSEEIRQSKEPFELIIKNPKNITVEKKNFNEKYQKSDKVFESHVHTLPYNPLLGEWAAIVRYGHMMEQSSTVHFTVKDYVVPTFKVELKAPDVILPNAEKIDISINAKYVHGKNLQGTVNFRLGVRKPNSPTADILVEVTGRELDDGAYNLRVWTEDMKKPSGAGWFPLIEGSYLFVEATVVDAATGNSATATDVACRFSTTPFVLSFNRCLGDFKPGLTSVFEADITYVGGKPAKDIKTKISAVANDGKALHIAEDSVISDSDGKVTFEIQTEMQHTSLTITLETIDERYEDSQAKGTFVQESYKSTNNAYLAISRMRPQRLRPDELFGRVIHFQPPEIGDTYYMVIAKGKILDVSKLPPGEFKAQEVKFQISYDMVPSFRVLAFAHYQNELIVDSLKFDLESVCHPNAKVEINPEFNVSEPGNNVKIIIKGKKDNTVGLLGVDAAIYAFSRRDLLTKAKLFNTLGSHDLGCGPGGGLTVDSVLGNAGITMGTNLYSPNQFHTCGNKIRRKRDLSEEDIDSWSNFGRRMDSVPDLFRIPLGDQEIIMKELNVRSDFRETWLLHDILIGLDDKEEVATSLPHSITTWVLQAVSLSPENGMCVAEPKKIESFKQIFLQLNFPYAVVRNEQVEIQAMVFNYGNEKIYAYVFMYGTADLYSESLPGEKGKNVTVLVEPQSAATVTFRVIPMEVKDYLIKVYVMTTKGSDAIEGKLHVVPEGITKEIDIPVKLDPTNIQSRQKTVIESEFYTDIIDPTENLQVTAIKLAVPEGFVPGTASCYITAIGDTFGPAVDTSIKNTENLIRLPLGSGEQNMILLAPTVYAMNYLKASGKLTAAAENSGYDFILKGYSNALQYRKNDGSYSNWSSTDSSTWLTAFVTQVFCQATKFAYIDPNVMCSGVKWLIENQNADGSYTEKTALNTSMLGGSRNKVRLTAFVLIALSECNCDEKDLMLAKQRANVYLESQIDDIKYSRSASIVAYALSLSNSDQKHLAISKLLALATYDEDTNRMYWMSDKNAGEITTAGYALMTLLLSKDMERCNSIVNWLNSQQLQSGAFKSTLDTVLALQALSKYTIEVKSTVNLVSNITYSNDMNWHKVLTLNEGNALLLQDVRINRVGGIIFIKTIGKGQGTLTAKLRYNMIVPIEDICKFEVTVNVTKVKDFVPQTADEKEPYVLNIALCVRYLGSDEAEMSIVDVGTFSGFEPHIRDLKKLQDDENHLIKMYETSSRGVVFYLEKVPTAERYCFNYHVLQKFYVGNIQMSAIRVYNYYNPDESCTKFYNPKNENSMLRTFCEGGKHCECAEGGCPEENPFAKYKNRNTGITKDNLIRAFCENYDFVWKGKLIKKAEKLGNGFFNITFQIDEVVKPGSEKKEYIKGKTRTLLTKDNCLEPFVRVTYLIAGKDGKAYQNARGETWYRYKLDKTSAVYFYTAKAEDLKLQRAMERATKALIIEGCNL